jgi:hypothetical protein
MHGWFFTLALPWVAQHPSLKLCIITGNPRTRSEFGNIWTQATFILLFFLLSGRVDGLSKKPIHPV